MISFVLEITPIPKGRPRKSKNGAVYTPDRTRKYEASIKAMAKKYFLEPLEGEIYISATYVFKNSDVWTHGKFAMVNADLDNLNKSLYDGLQGIAFKNDKQICREESCKVWGHENSIFVGIEEILQ